METINSIIVLVAVIPLLSVLLKASNGLREPVQQPPDLAEIIREAERQTRLQ